MKHSKWHVSRIALALLLGLVGLQEAAAQVTVLLGLKGPGQATVHLDRRSKTAYIVDLGKKGDGDKVTLEGRPLLDTLQSYDVDSLVFTCSHPHEDHAGGIRAIFENPDAFFSDKNLQKARFKSITVIDDGYGESRLSRILSNALERHPQLALEISHERLGKGFLVRSRGTNAILLRVQHRSARNADAFEEISKEGDAVFIRNIPYEAEERAGPHGRSVVTFTQLNGKPSLLDFDDANSTVVKRVVDSLLSENVDKVPIFVLPHHGSKYQDVQQIFRLKPEIAIISVNPNNQYHHPSLQVLEALVEGGIRPANILFTGSDHNIVLGSRGVITENYSAADPKSLRIFLDDQDAAQFENTEKVRSEPAQPSIDDNPFVKAAESDVRAANIERNVGEILTPEDRDDLMKRYRSGDPAARAEIERRLIEHVIEEQEHPE